MGAGAGYYNPMAGFNTKPPSDPKAWRDHFGVLAELDEMPKASSDKWRLGPTREEQELREENTRLRALLLKARGLPS